MHIHTIQLNIEKMLGGCAGMDATEFGAYMSLIVTCYQTGNVLPDDDARLARMARCSLKVWKRIRPTIAVKFTIIDGKWSHDVIQKEIVRYSLLSAKNKANALKGNKTEKPVASQSPSDRTANTSNNNQVTNNKEVSKRSMSDFDFFFDDFWSIFPKQRAGSKEKAKKALGAAIKRGTDLEIMEGLRSYAISDEVARGYAKGAAAWLNDDRWQNKYKTESEANARNSKKPIDSIFDEINAEIDAGASFEAEADCNVDESVYSGTGQLREITGTTENLNADDNCDIDEQNRKRNQRLL